LCRYRQTQYKSGYISEGDYLKIKLQLLQFQTDALARLVWWRCSHCEVLGYDAVSQWRGGRPDLPARAGEVEDPQAKALSVPTIGRLGGSMAAQSQISLAKANAKQDVDAAGVIPYRGPE
jgi:cobalt-zinc-cadmium efflux system outer membrane protein